MSIYINETIPYLYAWFEKTTGKWYIGSKIRNEWNPEKHEKYICGNKHLKNYILANRENFFYIILLTGKAAEIKMYETIVLKYFNAKENIKSFNQHNNDGIYSRAGVTDSEATKIKKRLARLGENNPMYGKKGTSSPHYGKKHTQDTINKQRDGVKKYSNNRPPSHNENISKSLKGNPKLIARVTGDKNPRFLGYYISPSGERFDSSRKAAIAAGVKDKKTLIKWAKNNKNGWSYKSKINVCVE